jgi:hypothetical protein
VRVVSRTFFSVLGIGQRSARPRNPTDVGAPPAVIASHAFWQDLLGGAPMPPGAIKLDGAWHTVVGVLPPRSGPLERRPDVFLVQQFSPPTRRGPFLYSVVARLREGTDRTAAAGELRAVNARIFPIWAASTGRSGDGSMRTSGRHRRDVGDGRPRARLDRVSVGSVREREPETRPGHGHRQELAVAPRWRCTRGS